jgi:mono/diheme cytochrome c family protein
LDKGSRDRVICLRRKDKTTMPRYVQYIVAFAVLTAGQLAAFGQTDARAEAAAVEFFEKKVRPLLVGNCYNCHSANTNAKGGLRVDDRNGLLQGGQSGPAVVPGNPEKGLLLRKVRHADESQRMPPKKQLSPEQIADLAQWIKDGAAWPKIRVPAAIGKPNPKYDKLRKEHWAWQPLTQVKPPPVRDASWPRGDIDRFIRARLEVKGLTPAGDADRLTLLRRVTFDLTGLPPSPEEIDAFLKDSSADAFERVADRLLTSPAFGERWGRHWLDVARYGESTGSARNLPYPHAWRYRDYVISAFNADKPYGQFLREQIAGDLLPARSQSEREEQLTATGFLAVGVKDVNQRFKVRFVMDNIDEQIDTVTRSVLALTASCARCHDHKFDPVPVTDYYALAGIFHSTDLCAGVRNKMGGGGLDYYDPAMLLLLGPGGPPERKPSEEIDKLKKTLAQARLEFEALRGTPDGKSPGPDGRPKQAIAREKMTRLQAELAAMSDPATTGKAALGVREARAIGNTEVRIRGEAEKLGPAVPRGFLTLIDVPDAPKINAKQSGRLELAQWLTSAKNPLTPRVMANRVWQHLFGQGLVTSVDNFGITGDVPSHPELLDHLAGQFVRDGWSVKKLVRAIVLSRAYQLSSEATAANLAADPANRLVWRHGPRRLDAEEIRDAMLAAAGTLAQEPARGSPAQNLKVIELRNNGPEAQRLQEEAQRSTRRSVYLPLLRGLTPRALEVFDFAEQGMVTGSRDTTTTAPQALYLLNDPFVRRQSLALADRLLRQKSLNDEGRIQLAYRLTLGRLAAVKEIARAIDYLGDYETAARKAGQADDALKEEPIKASDPKMAAWASFCQAILAAAEFRYIK